MKRPMRLEIYRTVTHDRALVYHLDGDGCPLTSWRWRIRATNGRIIADSGEAYGRLRDCAHGAGLVTGIGRGVDKIQAGQTQERCDGEGRIWLVTVTP